MQRYAPRVGRYLLRLLRLRGVISSLLWRISARLLVVLLCGHCGFKACRLPRFVQREASQGRLYYREMDAARSARSNADARATAFVKRFRR